MSIIILGDVHLGKGLSIGKPGIGSGLNSRMADQVKLLDWTLSKAIENHVSDIVITGDVFDEPKPNPSVINLFISWLKRCVSENLNVHIIYGNHDFVRSGSFISSPLDIVAELNYENIYTYKENKTVLFNNMGITFIPFKDRKSLNTDVNKEAIDIIQNQLSYELPIIPKEHFKLVIGHLALENSIPVGDEFNDLANELICPLSMFRGYDYVFMGHVHKPQVLSKLPYISHIGSMDISDFGECNQKKHIVIFNPDELIPFKYIEIPSRKLTKISIQVPENVNTTEYVENYIKYNHDDIQDHTVQIDISLTQVDATPVNKKKIEELLHSFNVHHVPKFIESKKIALIKDNNKNVNIDSHIDENKAIQLYANKFVDEKYQEKFIKSATDLIFEFNLDKKE